MQLGILLRMEHATFVTQDFLSARHVTQLFVQHAQLVILFRMVLVAFVILNLLIAYHAIQALV